MHPYLKQCLHNVKCITQAVLFIINNLYAIPVFLVWMAVLSPLALLAPAIYWKMEAFLFHSLVTMAGILSHAGGYDLVELGDTIDELEHEHCLFLINHQSTADVPVVMAMMATRQAASNGCYWIMDAMFKWTHFGMVSQVRGDFFVECGKAKRDKSVEELKEALTKNYMPLNRKWIILFPEGGFLWKRRATSQRFAEKQGLPHLEHVTLPRVGAARAVMQQLSPVGEKEAHTNGHGDHQSRDVLRYVVDLTLAYPEPHRPLHVLDIMSGSRPPCTIYTYYRVYRVDEVPCDTEGLTAWLYQLFVDKEAALTEYYRTGTFPAMPGGRRSAGQAATRPRLLRQDVLGYLLRQVFFLGSVALFVQVGIALWTLLTGR